MVLVKIGNLSIFLFQEKKATKMCFPLFQKKNALLHYKNRKLKKSSACDFSKGIGPQFQSKITNFTIFSFQAKKIKKMCFTIIQKEKTPYRPEKQNVEEVEKLRFFQRCSSMVLIRNWQFFHFFLLGKKGQKNVFYGVLER